VTITIASIGNGPSSEREDPKKVCQKKMIWHLLQGITLWTIWIERNDQVFNQEHWHESNLKHLIWDELIMHSIVAWARVVKFVEIGSFLERL
jgi:hypothetical protein